MEERIEQNNSAHSIKWGVILGIIGILITLTAYVVDLTLLTSPWTSVIVFIVYIGLLFYASIDYRSNLGGFMTFGQAFLHAFVLLAIAGILDVSFKYVLFNIVDPEAATYLLEAQMEASMEMMQKFGGEGNPQMMDEMAEGLKGQFQLGSLALGYAFSLIWYAIGASIVGLITKKKNPEGLEF